MTNVDIDDIASRDCVETLIHHSWYLPVHCCLRWLAPQGDQAGVGLVGMDLSFSSLGQPTGLLTAPHPAMAADGLRLLNTGLLGVAPTLMELMLGYAASQQ
eukprot:COSAG05_NODE_147_length_16383_cov_266.102555_13_plen_101_part_00